MKITIRPSENTVTTMVPERTDASTIESVYMRVSTDLIRFATSLVGPNDAPDLVASAVAKCMTRQDWTSLENPEGYLYRAVLNESRSLFRRTATRTKFSPLLNEPTKSNRGTEDDTVEYLRLSTFIRRLSPQQRAIIFLTYWHDLSVTDTAEQLGISQGAVKKQLARARRKLRKELNEDEIT